MTDKPNDVEVGDGHVRQCRDFSKLDNWALEHSSCYTSEDLEAPYFKDQRYANCPKDSPWFLSMRDSLGLDEDWEPPYRYKHGPTFASL